MEVTRRRGRRRKKLLDDLRERERIRSSDGGAFKSHYVEESIWRRQRDLSLDRLLNEMN
jgi:hypothetical protein